MDTCRMLRRVFGDDMYVLPVLAAWARAEIARVKELEELREDDGGATGAYQLDRVEIEAPTLYYAMYQRPYQLAGAAFTAKAKQSILGDEPGLGKTLQTLAAIIQSDAGTILVGCRRTATRTVWERETLRWTPTIYPWVAQGPRTEREAAMTEFHSARTITETRRMLIVNIEMIRAKRVEVCPQDLGENCLAKVNGQCRHKFEATYDWPFLFEQEWDAIVLDECFPAGTMIDGRPIESIKAGDYVPSWDEGTGGITRCRVTSASSRKAPSLVRIFMEDGTSFCCTFNHPILTTRGWQLAGKLEHYDSTVYFKYESAKSSGGSKLRTVQEEVHDYATTWPDEGSGKEVTRTSPEYRGIIPCIRPGVLFVRVPRYLDEQKVLGNYDEDSASSFCGNFKTYAQEKSYGRSRYAYQDGQNTACYGSQADYTRRQRTTFAGATSPTSGTSWVGDRSNGSDWGWGASSPLQYRYRQPEVEDWDRGRRLVTLQSGSPSLRPSEGRTPVICRVDRVEVLEPGSDGQYGGMCPEGKVYNIEVEGTHTYLICDGLVVHNSHNLLASTANYQSKRITQARYGAVMLRRKLKPDGLAVALSGTPFRSNLTKGWGTLNWLRPDVFGSYWQWAGTHFGVEQGRYGQIVGGGAKVPRPLDEAVWDAMLRPYYLKRTKAEVAKDLPPIMYAGTPIDPDDPGSPCYVQIEMEDKQAKAYHQMVADAEADIEGGKILATGILAEITRQRQFANAYGHLDSRNEVSPALPSNKLDWITEFMQEREGTGLKVVIASSFSEMVELTASTLRKEGFEVLTLTGATSDRKRSDLVARFQDPNDSLQVVVINRKAGGESITLDAADSMVVIDPPWLSDDDEQLYARIHRVSRIHQVTIYRLLSTGTVDELMAGLTQEQRAVLATADPRKLSDLIREANTS